METVVGFGLPDPIHGLVLVGREIITVECRQQRRTHIFNLLSGSMKQETYRCPGGMNLLSSHGFQHLRDYEPCIQEVTAIVRPDPGATENPGVTSLISG